MNEEQNVFEDQLNCKAWSSFDEAWKEVKRIYEASISGLKEKFELYHSIVKETNAEYPKNGEEISSKAMEIIISRCNNELKGAKSNYTYPLIGIKPENDLIGDINEFENKILFKDWEYWITITHPTNALLSKYYREEFTELTDRYTKLNEDKKLKIHVGASNLPIPLTFAFDVDGSVHSEISNPTIRKLMANYFALPDLTLISDAILERNHKKYKFTYENLILKTFNENVAKGKSIFNNPLSQQTLHPLTHFDALRTDSSMHRLKHYTHTEIDCFQPFVIFTNYENYVYKFLDKFNEKIVKEGEGELIIATAGAKKCIVIDKDQKELHKNPDGSYKIDRTAQMPAFHYRPAGGKNGITLINIGVGPSNAKTITDHLAVLRPYCWLMLGHCGGLRYRQQLGQFISAKSFVREDNVLDDVLSKDLVSLSVPLIIQNAFESATWSIISKSWKEENDSKQDAELSEEKKSEEVQRISKFFRSKMRTGTVYTTADRNWEFKPIEDLIENIEISRALAIDMESATIAGNGYRYRVPFGAFLCISDLPLHGESKMRNMADKFYNESTAVHLEIALEAISELSSLEKSNLTKLDGDDNISNFQAFKTLRELRGGFDPVFR